MYSRAFTNLFIEEQQLHNLQWRYNLLIIYRKHYIFDKILTIYTGVFIKRLE